MSSDLISRKEAIEATWEEPSYTDPLNVLTEVRDRVKAIPSADIMECAKAIKEYCNQFSKCEDCGCLNKNYCAFYTCPDEWNLPEGEKE